MSFPKSKFLGQHFLQDRKVLGKIIEAAVLKRSDVVLEIGPGRGVLTEALTRKSRRVIAVEKDEGLVRFLKQRFHQEKTVEIIAGDILRVRPRSFGLKGDSFKIVANIPYYLTGKLLRRIFEDWPRPKLIVLMLQKEVAKRITAKPPKMNLLSLSVQYFSKPEIISFVPKTAFSPNPRVDSAIIVFRPRAGASRRRAKHLFSIARLGFSHPRKLLLNNLARTYPKPKLVHIFRNLHIPLLARPSNLSLETWRALGEKLT